MRHIRLAALVLFVLALPAQAGAWDVPSYSEEDFCEEAMSHPDILGEPMREALEHSVRWPDQCTELEKYAGYALAALNSAIEASVSEDDIRDCEVPSWTPEGNGSYYKLADCLFDIGQRWQMKNDSVSKLPIYNFLELCRNIPRERGVFGNNPYVSCVRMEHGALFRLGTLTAFEPRGVSPNLIRDCNEKINTAKGYKSYQILHNCALEEVKAERRRRRQELMQEER